MSKSKCILLLMTFFLFHFMLYKKHKFHLVLGMISQFLPYHCLNDIGGGQYSFKLRYIFVLMCFINDACCSNAVKVDGQCFLRRCLIKVYHPYYLSREFTCLSVVAVYICWNVNLKNAIHKLHEVISNNSTEFCLEQLVLIKQAPELVYLNSSRSTPQTGDTLPWNMRTQTFQAAKALFCQQLMKRQKPQQLNRLVLNAQTVKCLEEYASSLIHTLANRLMIW